MVRKRSGPGSRPAPDIERQRIRKLTPKDLVHAPDGMVIAWNFRRLRERLGLTQEQAAEIGNCNVSYIGKVETAKVSFATRAQTKWARILKTDRSEFLRRPDIGVRVKGVVMEKGIISPPAAPRHRELEFVPLPPGYTQSEADDKHIFGLKVHTDALYPHMRKDWIYYAMRMPTYDVRSDDLVVITQDNGTMSVKEVERLADGRMILKGLGKGQTTSMKDTDTPTMDVIFHHTRMA